MSQRRYALRDDQWKKIRELLPGRKGSAGRTAKNNRLFVEAVLYRYRAGIPWRDLPERFGGWKNVHRRHSRWAAKGIWKLVFERLSDEPDNEYAMIDSTIVRAHQHAAGAKKGGGQDRERSRQAQCLGRSKGGLSTKIHATCDALGNPTGFFLSPGQAHDLVGADALMDRIEPAEALLADKAYDADKRVLGPLERAGVKAVIPSKANRKQPRSYDEHLYQRRHLVENLFQKLKQYRAIATRYDKRADIFLSAIHLAAALIWTI